MLLDETRQALIKQFEHTDILDHGFIRLDDLMGDDHDVCRSARISTGNTRGKRDLARDAKLIHYLVRNHHDSPLEMCSAKLHIRLPIFVMRQMVRHRTAKLNELSGRYSEIPHDFYVPEQDQIRQQDTINRQGSAAPVEDLTGRRQCFEMRSIGTAAFDQYDVALDAGVSRETARMMLPLATYTEIFWQMDLRNLLHFIELRASPHAQYEIRVYADVLAKIVAAWVPQVWDAFEQYRLHSTTASWAVMKALAKSPEVMAAIMKALEPDQDVMDYRATADDFLAAIRALI